MIEGDVARSGERKRVEGHGWEIGRWKEERGGRRMDLILSFLAAILYVDFERDLHRKR